MDIFRRQTFLLLAIAACFLTLVWGCKIPLNQDSPPPAAPIYFAVLDHNGRNLVTSFKDTAWVTFTNTSEAQKIGLPVLRVQQSLTDTTLTSKYGGFILTDNDLVYAKGLIGGASQHGARNFELFINGNDVGNIYYSYSEYQKDVDNGHSLSANFLLNGKPIVRSNDGGAFVIRSKRVIVSGDTWEVLEMTP